jgi:hypothetical protein
MDSVEDYVRRWIKREVDQDPESLSDWVRTIRFLVQGRIHKLKKCVNSRPKSVFKDAQRTLVRFIRKLTKGSSSSSIGGLNHGRSH